MNHAQPRLSHTALTLALTLTLAACSQNPLTSTNVSPTSVPAAPAIPKGEITGRAVSHTPASAKAVMDQAALVLPASLTGGAVFAG